MNAYSNKVVVVTGASEGIGQAIGKSPSQESRIMTADRCAELMRVAIERRKRLLITSGC